MSMKYGVFGKGRNGKYQPLICEHPKCFGGLWKLHELIHEADVVPDQTRFFCNTKFTKQEFDQWWPRLVEDFPTFKANDRVIKAPRAVYYDANSSKFGSVKGIGPHIVIKFEDDIDNQQMYLIVKFYLKNICMPRTGESGTHYLWRKAEELLKANNLPATMPYIMALNSMSAMHHTDGYAWPIPGGAVEKGALKTFLGGLYEAEITKDDQQPRLYTRQFLKDYGSFDYGSPRNRPKGLTILSVYRDGAYRYPEGIDVLPTCIGYDGAIQRLKETLK